MGIRVENLVNHILLIWEILQLYNFRKRPLPADDDKEGMTQLALKLTKYDVFISEYEAAIKDIDVPW